MSPVKCFFLSVAFACFLVTGMYAQQEDVQKWLNEAKTAQQEYNETKALDLYNKVLAVDANNLTAMFNTGYIYLRQGWMAEDDNELLAEQLYRKAKMLAEKTYALYPHTFEANLSMAGATARLARFLSAKERVYAAWDIKKYADSAAYYQPNSPDLKHLLAWWNYELTKPTWLERSLANMLFGGIPNNADMSKSVKLMQELISKRPDYTVYQYDLAIFYNYMGNKDKAIELLKNVLKLSPKVPEDHSYLKSAKKFLDKLL